jgi:hypothetical protein
VFTNFPFLKLSESAFGIFFGLGGGEGLGALSLLFQLCLMRCWSEYRFVFLSFVEKFNKSTRTKLIFPKTEIQFHHSIFQKAHVG